MDLVIRHPSASAGALALTCAALLACGPGDGGTGETETGETGDESPDEGEYSLDRGRELPAAQTTMWQEGAQPEPTGVSTPERFAAAGDQSWALALDLLRETEPSKHPSIAHSPAALTILRAVERPLRGRVSARLEGHVPRAWARGSARQDFRAPRPRPAAHCHSRDAARAPPGRARASSAYSQPLTTRRASRCPSSTKF
ncbi:MAG: hypothetical protein H6713_13845 [Myxococcales bacterium]|nr:hypothetical protein [Myxococcales bacterium]